MIFGRENKTSEIRLKILFFNNHILFVNGRKSKRKHVRKRCYRNQRVQREQRKADPSRKFFVIYNK